MQPFLRDWLIEEVKRGQHEETIALLTRLARDIPSRPEYLVARGETYRLRGGSEDLDKALADYQAAVSFERRHRGSLPRPRDDPAAARSAGRGTDQPAALSRAGTEAPDAAMVKSYVKD